MIIVDDGSTDTSAKKCDLFAKLDERFKVFHTNNNGVSEARNFGIAQSSEEYIVFVCSDDWLDVDFCSSMVQGEKNIAHFVICGNYNEASSVSTIRSLFNGSFF